MPEAAAGQKGAGGQTDRVWDGQTPLADTGRGWSYCCVPLAPWHIWVLHLPLCGFPSSVTQPGQGCSVFGAGEGTVDLQRGKETTVQLSKQYHASAHKYVIYYISYELYNICTYICGDLEGTFLWNDQHFLPPRQQLLAQCTSALSAALGILRHPRLCLFLLKQSKNPYSMRELSAAFPFQCHLRATVTPPGAGSRGDARPPWTLSGRGCSRCSGGCSAACCSSATS